MYITWWFLTKFYFLFSFIHISCYKGRTISFCMATTTTTKTNNFSKTFSSIKNIISCICYCQCKSSFKFKMALDEDLCGARNFYHSSIWFIQYGKMAWILIWLKCDHTIQFPIGNECVKFHSLQLFSVPSMHLIPHYYTRQICTHCSICCSCCCSCLAFTSNVCIDF